MRILQEYCKRVLCAGGVVASGLAFLLATGCQGQPPGGPVAFPAAQGTFVHEVRARGTVFSQGGTEVKCEVDGAGPEGTMILQIVPEGTSVRPGDPLLQLDDSVFTDNLIQQQIVCNRLEADVTAATSEREKAQLAHEEYRMGLYPEEKKAAENDLFAADQKLGQAERTLEATKGDTDPKEDPAEDMEALRFNVEMAKLGVEAAKKRIDVLDHYTKPLRLKQLDGEVRSAEAVLHAKESELALHKDRLARIEKQIASCTIAAPVAGVVFYANVPGETEEEEILIGEGVAVRNRQVILHVAQLDQLSVRIEVPESDIAQVQTGMAATVVVDTMPDTPFEGHVSKVHPYPTVETRGSTDGKKYEVHVGIDKPSGNLRPGLTAEVILTLTELTDAIQVPATSVFRENGQKLCLIRQKNRWVPRPVVVGPSDEKMIVIREGIEPGEEVAIHPLQYREGESR